MVYKKVGGWTSGRRVPRIKLRWIPPRQRGCPFNVGSAWYRYRCKMEKAPVTISFQKCPQIQGSTRERPGMVLCKSAAGEISFEWSHYEIFITNSLRAAVQTVCRYVCHNKTLSPFSYTWAGHLAYSLANTNACERRTNTTFQVGEGGLKETENEVKNNFKPLWKLATPVFFFSSGETLMIKEAAKSDLSFLGGVNMAGYGRILWPGRSYFMLTGIKNVLIKCWFTRI